MIEKSVLIPIRPTLSGFTLGGFTLMSLTLVGFTLMSLIVTVAQANEPVPNNTVGGVIDAPATTAPVTAAGVEQIVEQIKEQVDKEQEELASKDREELEQRANNGERLAQVALGDDFADEAQQILFVPEAANSAISDALAWYSLAAQRGFPGSLSLDSSGVKLHPVRVVRNR